MVLAHQGGWDEFLITMAPIVVVGIGFLIASLRSKDESEDDRPGRR